MNDSERCASVSGSPSSVLMMNGSNVLPPFTWSLAAALLMGILTAPRPTLAQSSIAADRPGLGIGSATMGVRDAQIELGYSYAEEDGRRLHNLGELMLRYGATNSFELRGGIGTYGFVVEPPGSEGGYRGATLGTKVRLHDGSLSTMSAAATLNLPVETHGFDTDEDRLRQTLVLAFEGTLGTGLRLLANAGPSFFYTGDDAATEGLFTTTLEMDLGGNVGGYVGYGGFYRAGANTNFVEGGVTYLASLNTQLDLNTGLQVDTHGNDFFVGVGLAHRF